MSIEKLEFFINDLNIDDITLCEAFTLIISIFKDQSAMIANLSKQLAQKEDKIDINDIKEVKNING